MSIRDDKHSPKILLVTSHWPLAPAYGAQQRVLNTARILKRFGDLSLVLVPTEQEDEETEYRTRREFNVCRVIRPLRTAQNKSVVGLSQRLRHECDPTYMGTDPYVASDADRAFLSEVINQYDVVWIHTIRTANWFRLYRWPHSVLDADDMQSRTHRSVAMSSRNPATRLVNLRRSWIWRRHERHFEYRFDVLAVCSEDDRQYLGMEDRTYVIPNGAHPGMLHPRVSTKPPRIGFIGNCEFMPNVEGLKWFIREVWPVIKRQMPQVHLRLVGRSSEAMLTKLGPDIMGLGWLEDPGNEIATWSAMIVPIRVGGGTRVKVAEGFARKCPVVATALGAFGYAVQNGEEILLADRASDFACSCLALLKDPQLGMDISDRAHKRFLKQWTWSSCEETIGAALQQCRARDMSTEDANTVTALTAKQRFGLRWS